MDHALEVVVLAVSAFLTALLLSSSKLLSDTGTNFVKTYNSKVTDMSVSLNSADASSYNGVILSGADVMNAIKRYVPDGVTVTVVTKNITGLNEDTGEPITDADDTKEYKGDYAFPSIDEAGYINPSAEFLGTANTNTEYGYLTSMRFEQVKATHIAEAASSRPSGGGGGTGGGQSQGYEWTVSPDLTSLNDAVAEISEALKALAGQLTTILTSPTPGSGGGDQSSASANIATALQNLQTAVRGLREDTASADASINAKLSSLVESVSSMQSSISALQTTVNGLSAGSSSGVDLSGIEASLGQLRDKLADLQGTTASATDVKNLQSQVTDTTNPNSLASKLSSLQTTVNGLASKITSLETSVRKLQQATGTGG